ncbi:S8 family serine peptidase [Saccharothrix obliqua]|uniref:S8 family serine peptidase n=1 Tax=Saccharothrix obliqua TaxID=2861747 RepID=UPI001C5D5202|nr:S8 family serine peptidase [Saccharothrix obliqua]MBW4721992.1 S8 family serine peptidase [Saccharothrix obliqua]
MSRSSTALLVAGLLATAVTAGPPANAVREPDVPAPGPRGTVTLVTGDQVTVRDGRAEVRPGEGRADVVFRQHRDERGDLHVVPSDAAGAVRDGRLDERLFDVTGLLRAGYDDRSTATTPLIVVPGAAPLAAGGRELPSLGGHAVEVPKDTGFWSATRAADVTGVWLDGPVRAALDRSVPQVGAPEAWRAGHTGRGAVVAVLDTGIDATHPDLAGAVLEAKDFSGSGGTDDRVGHGTHVAATITGAGRYQGVAPDSSLLVGKVLGDSGGGRESDVVAGMEWAAARADVVNLSLGSSWPSDGDDPMSRSLNRISAETGALFVVAAGNTGPEGVVGSPAAADAALTVGAVDREDRLAGFSSRGPRWQDHAIKPDITAPGVGIVAAKAANGRIGDPVDAGHVALSGTSMATPHVAGAAAVLAARHPDWTAPRLKSALLNSATPNPDRTVYEQGAGRVDVARAVRQAVSASPASLSLGTAAWPHRDDAPIEREVVYRNDGTAPVTLRVEHVVEDPAGRPAPAGMVTVTPAEVTIAPGASASVAVTVRTALDGPDGLYGGELVATGGDTAVRTPIGVDKEVESYDVKLSFLDHDGALTPDFFYRFVSTTRRQAYVDHDPSGVVVARLPKDAYYFDATVGLASTRQTTYFGEPRITVDGPTELVFDARAGNPVSVAVGEPDARVGSSSVSLLVRTDHGDTGFGVIAGDFDGIRYAPSKTSFPGRSSWTVQARLAADGAVSPYLYRVSRAAAGGIPADLGYRFADRDLVVAHTTVAAAGPGQTGFLDSLAGGPLPLRVTTRNTPDVDWYGAFLEMPRPDAHPPLSFQQTAGPVRYRAGRPVAERWNAAVFGPAFPDTGRPDEWAARSGDEVRVSLPLFTDQDANHYGFARTTAARTTLHRDGVLVAETPGAGSVRTSVPAGRAAFRLGAEAERESGLSTRVTGTWEFTSDTTAGPTSLPLTAVRFAPTLDDHNRAAAGKPFVFPVYVQRNGGADPGDVRLTVQVSYDDGGHWRPVPLAKVGTRWVAAVVHPADAKHVSLRASGRDQEGNTVTQTVIRAYGLR